MEGNTIFRAGILIFALSICPFATALASEQAEQILRLTFLNETIDQMPRILRHQYQQEFRTLTSLQSYYMTQALRYAYAGETLRRDMISWIGEHMPDDAAVHGIQWLKTPLGRKIALLVMENQIPDPKAMHLFENRYRMAQPDRERLQRLQRIASATGSFKMFVRYRRAIYTQMLFGVNTLLSPHKQYLPASLNDSQAQPLILRWYLFLYRQLDDREIDRFADFLESTRGSRYEEVLNEALFQAQKNAALRFADAMRLDRRIIVARAADGLDKTDQRLADKLRFDSRTLLLAKSYSFLVGQLEGVRDDRRQPVNGLTLSIPSKYGYLTLEMLRKKFQDTGYAVYYLEKNEGTDLDKLAIIKNDNPFAYLALVGTQEHHGHLMDTLSEWHEKYGLRWIGAGENWLEAEFIRQPANMDSFAKEVIRLCPGLMQKMGSLKQIVDRMRDTNRLYMEWPKV